MSNELNLQSLQIDQVSEEYRLSLEILRMKISLLRIMLSERGVLRESEWDKSWSRYLKNDVGVLDQGKMSGSLKIKFYGEC